MNIDLIAVTDREDVAGAIIFWRLSGPLPVSTFTDRWLEAGLPGGQLPAAPPKEVALRRAVYEQQGRRLLVRPLAKRKGWAIVREEAAGDSVTHRQVGLVTTNGTLYFPPEEQHLRDRIAEEIDRRLQAWDPEDISNWLIRQSYRLGAQSLRDRGGLYFVLRESVPEWRRMVALLEACSQHKVYEIPALQSDKAVEAILDAVELEAREELAKIDEEVDADKLGTRALENRKGQLEALEAKVARYEGALGKKLAALRDHLGATRAMVVEASLAADDEKGEAA